MEHPAVAEAGVIGKPDPVVGERGQGVRRRCAAATSPDEELRDELLGLRPAPPRAASRRGRSSSTSTCRTPAAARSCAACSRPASSGCPRATCRRWSSADPTPSAPRPPDDGGAAQASTWAGMCVIASMSDTVASMSLWARSLRARATASSSPISGTARSTGLRRARPTPTSWVGPACAAAPPHGSDARAHRCRCRSSTSWPRPRHASWVGAHSLPTPPRSRSGPKVPAPPRAGRRRAAYRARAGQTGSSGAPYVWEDSGHDHPRFVRPRRDHARQAVHRRPRGQVGAGMGRAGHLRLRPRAALAGRASRSSRSTPRRPTASGVAAHRPRLQLHAHRLHGPLQADGRASRSSTRSAGTTTACRPSAGCRTTTACAATRRCPTTRASQPPQQGGDGKSVKAADQQPISRGRTSSSCATILTVEDEKAFESLFRRLGLQLDWDITYRTIDDRSRATAQQAFLRNLAPRRGLPGRGARACGTSRSRPPSPRPSSRPATTPAPTTASPSTARRRRAGVHRDHPPRAASRRCVALIAHPDDERYQPLFGTTVTSPLFGVEVPVLAHPAGRDRQGRRHRHVLHLRRPHRRACGGASCSCRPARSSPATAGSAGRDARVDHRRARARALFAELAGKTTFCAREAVVAALRESGDLDGEPTADPAQGELLREGRQAARDRHLAPVVHPQRRPRRATCAPQLIAARRGARLPPRVHALALRELGRRPQRRLADLRQRFFGVPIPVWYPLDADGEVDYDHPIVPDRGRAAGRPGGRRARPATTSRQRGEPGGFVGDPDVMDTWATSSLTPADRRRLARPTPTLFAKVFPMDVRPQGHDIIRTWLFSTVVALALRARLAAVEARRDQRLDPRPRPQEDEQVQGQRRSRRGLLEEHGATRCATGRPPAASAPTPPTTPAR